MLHYPLTGDQPKITAFALSCFVDECKNGSPMIQKHINRLPGRSPCCIVCFRNVYGDNHSGFRSCFPSGYSSHFSRPYMTNSSTTTIFSLDEDMYTKGYSRRDRQQKQCSKPQRGSSKWCLHVITTFCLPLCLQVLKDLQLHQFRLINFVAGSKTDNFFWNFPSVITHMFMDHCC